MEKEIVNRVASSSIVTFDLEELYQPGDRVSLDIKDQLYEGLVLREKDFRAFIKQQDWTLFKDKFVSVQCSADAIVPTWAFMLVTIALQPYARRVVFGAEEDLEKILFLESLEKIEWVKFKDAKVVVKGCSKVNVPVSAYVEAVSRLRPLAKTIMFGEPCSTVPLFKKSGD